MTLAAIADSTGEAERQRLDAISPQFSIGLDGMQSYRPSFDVDSFSKTFANKTDAERDAADAAFTAKFGKSLEKVASEQLSGSDLDNVLNLIKRRDGDVVGQRERDLASTIDNGTSGGPLKRTFDKFTPPAPKHSWIRWKRSSKQTTTAKACSSP